MSKSRPENRRAFAKSEYGAVTILGQPVTRGQKPGFGKHTKGGYLSSRRAQPILGLNL